MPNLDLYQSKEPNLSVKTCIKAAAYVKLQLLGAASIQLRLLFESGLYAKSWVCKIRKSGLAKVKWKWNLTLRLFQISFECKQTFGMRRAVAVSPTLTTLGGFFELRLLYECGLCATWVRRKCGFSSSADSNQVRFLYTTLRYPRRFYWYSTSFCLTVIKRLSTL